MNCEFCKSVFTQRRSLYAHQRGANYCLKIQRQVKLKCEYCGDVTVKDEKQHYCHQKVIYHLEKQNEELKEMLKQKDKVIEEIALKSASTPKTITNNNTNNTTTTTTNNKYEFLAPFHLTSEYIKKKVDESFTEEYFLKGQKGVASFTYENLLIDEDTGKQNYYCSDLSRKIFVYKKKQGGGKVRKDFKSSNLTNLIATDIIDKSKCLYEDGMRKIRRSVKNDSEIFDKSLVYVNNMCDIKGMRINNNGFVLKLCGLVCNRSRSPFLMKDDDDNELVYVIESTSSEEDEDEDDEEDLSKYTKEYFESKEALIENFRESAMYETFKKQLEAEKAKYWRE